MLKKYTGQSLAIVLVLLLVGSIIGFVIYARMVRESERIVDERASSEANELVETTIGLLGTLGYEQIKNDSILAKLDGCHEMELFSSGCRVHNLNLREMEDLLSAMGIKDIDLSGFAHDADYNYCLSELALSNLAEEGVTIEKDNAYSVFLNNVESWENCQVEFAMENLENQTNGFIMSTFYVQRDGDGEIIIYKPYHFEDIVGFLYKNDEKEEENWKGYKAKTELKFSSEEGTYPIKKEMEGVTYELNEIRFKSLGGDSNLTWSSDRGCNMDNLLLIEVGATCGDNYVGKSFILPEEYFAPPMFDYVYFQGKGGLN